MKYLTAAIRFLKRRKKAPMRFYKKREHTIEGIEVYRARSSSPFSLILVLLTRISSFFVKEVIDQSYKIY